MQLFKTLCVAAILTSLSTSVLARSNWSFTYIPDPWDYPSRIMMSPQPYYAPPPVIVPQAPVVVSPPPVYVEQSQPQAATASGGNWSYCPSSKAYYPYVKECSMPWQSVAPQSAPYPQ